MDQATKTRVPPKPLGKGVRKKLYRHRDDFYRREHSNCGESNNFDEHRRHTHACIPTPRRGS